MTWHRLTCTALLIPLLSACTPSDTWIVGTWQWDWETTLQQNEPLFDELRDDPIYEGMKTVVEPTRYIITRETMTLSDLLSNPVSEKYQLEALPDGDYVLSVDNPPREFRVRRIADGFCRRLESPVPSELRLAKIQNLWECFRPANPANQ